MKNKILDISSIGDDFKDKYIVYNRKSTDDADNQKNSIEYQEQENLRLASRDNLKLANIDIYGLCENGIIKEHHSGYKSDIDFEILEDGSVNQKVSRPKFIKLVQLLQSKKIKGVIVLSWDRISRNEHDDGIIKKLTKAGADFRFVQANYEDNSAGDLHRDIDGMMARNFSRVISEKVKLANKKLVNEGKCIHSSPIGYLDLGSSNKPFDPERAPIVKKIFEMYATGNWSASQLSKWATTQGLTTKPMRRKRSKEERSVNLEIADIPKYAKQVTHKTIENILSNPFYIGKMTHIGQLLDSKAHQALIDTGLFYKVQSILKQKTVSVYYPEIMFQPYRGIIRCGCCGRAYSPYEQKGIIYYRVKCKPDCTNENKNISFEYINTKIKEILGKIYFTDEEIERINKEAVKELNKITVTRNSELDDLNRQLKKHLEDMDYLSQNKLSFMRKEVMTIEQIKEEELRLSAEISATKEKISQHADSDEVLLDYILTFSELMKNALVYFTYALDTERQEIVSQIFTELLFEGDNIKYSAKQGFTELLSRHNDPSWVLGSSGRDRTLTFNKILYFTNFLLPDLESNKD